MPGQSINSLLESADVREALSRAKDRRTFEDQMEEKGETVGLRECEDLKTERIPIPHWLRRAPEVLRTSKAVGQTASLAQSAASVHVPGQL